MGAEASERPAPFIWASWLAKVMAGRADCEWQYWFQTHHKLLTKHPSSFDAVGWNIDHNRLLHEVKREVTSRGLSPYTEFGLSFQLPEVEVTISGKADCLVVDGTDALVIDCKTGHPHDCDQVQVMIYMYALATYPQYAASNIRGIVIYRNARVEIPQLPERFVDNLTYYARFLASEVAPERQPGAACTFCNIAAIDCPERI